MAGDLEKLGAVNRVVLWHLRLCLKILDKAGYVMAAAHVATAIDALEFELKSDRELIEAGLAHDEHVDAVLRMFANQKKIEDASDDQ